MTTEVRMRLAEARARKLLSIRDLAIETGVSRASIYAIEAGKTVPSLRTIRKLVNALGVAPEEIDEFRAGIERTARGRAGDD